MLGWLFGKKEKRMSSDNGIVIGSFPGKEGKEYRVIHAMALDNLDYEPDDSGFNSKIVADYFEDAHVFTMREEAILFAHKWSQDFLVLEYGVSHVAFPLSFAEFQKRAGKVKVETT